jgi:hypothetical protein
MRLLPPAQSSSTDPHCSEIADNPPGFSQDHSSPDLETESDAEIDQLESDSDVEEIDAESSNDQNDQNGAIRPPGCSLLPTPRLESILQADGVTGNLTLSKEALFVLSVATEEFIKRMARTGQMHSSAQRRIAVSYVDMAASTQQYQEFMFLKDTIPAPMSLAEAIQLRQAKEKEMLEDDPALAVNPPAPTLFPLQNGASSLKPKGKGRNAVNGHEKTNGKASSATQERHFDPVYEFLANQPWNTPKGSTPSPSPENMPPFINGNMPPQENLPRQTFTAQDSYDGRLGHVSPHHAYCPPPSVLPSRPDETWLRGPGLVDPSDNLGRTIYTKDRSGG